MFGMRELRNT